MTEDQSQYEIKVGQHGKNCECSKCQPHRDCHNCGRPISGDACTMKPTEVNTCLGNPSRPFWQQKTDREKLERYLEWGKQNTALNDIGHTHACNCSECGESAKDYNRDQEGMPCDFCSHHVFGAPSYCITCDPENSNYDACEFEVEADAMLPSDHEAIEKRGACLRKALEIINGERQDSYGNPEDSFALIAKYWNAYLIELQKAVLVRHGFDPAEYSLVDMLDGRHVAEMMALFKIARMSGQKTTGDNYADAAGYIALAGDMI